MTNDTHYSEYLKSLPNFIHYSKYFNGYYYKALDSIPKDHSHRDELISLLIDQVLDDAYH